MDGVAKIPAKKERRQTKNGSPTAGLGISFMLYVVAAMEFGALS